MAVRIQFRRGTSTEWYNANPILSDGEIGYETDTKIIKFGDGATAWRVLAVAAAGDITAVYAGTGLTGGASSGAATLAVDTSYVVTASAINYKGDMIVGLSPGNYSRFPAGADGSVLVSDSTQNLGVKWVSSNENNYPTPTGSVIAFAGNYAPNGFLLCNGAAVSRSTYSVLYGVIGTTYGVGDGSTTFNLPNLDGKVVVGYDISQTAFNAVGKAGGATTHTLTTSELPTHNHSHTMSSDGSHSHSGSLTEAGSHRHIQQDFELNYDGYGFGVLRASRTRRRIGESTEYTDYAGTHNHDLTISSGGTHSHSVTIGNTGDSEAHNNLQPYMVMRYIIKT